MELRYRAEGRIATKIGGKPVRSAAENSSCTRKIGRGAYLLALIHYFARNYWQPQSLFLLPR